MNKRSRELLYTAHGTATGLIWSIFETGVNFINFDIYLSSVGPFVYEIAFEYISR
jgi:hypothetical protein